MKRNSNIFKCKRLLQSGEDSTDILLDGNSTGSGTGYLLRKGKETIWFSCYSVIP